MIEYLVRSKIGKNEMLINNSQDFSLKKILRNYQMKEAESLRNELTDQLMQLRNQNELD